MDRKMLKMQINMEANRKMLLSRGLSSTHIRAAVRTTIMYAIQHGKMDFHGKRFELSLRIADDTALAALNYQFRRKNEPTNVLSFPADDVSDTTTYYLGDVAISLETVERESEMYGKSIYERMMHVVVHGVLHLLNYDHINMADQLVMERAEREVLEEFSITDPYTVG